MVIATCSSSTRPNASDVDRPRPLDRQWMVAAAGEQLRVRALVAPARAPTDRASGRAGPIRRLGEQPRPPGEIDGRRLSGSTRLKSPEFGTLIDVGHARHRQLEQKLDQSCWRGRQGRSRRTNAAAAWAKSPSGHSEDRRNSTARPLVGLVRLVPVRALLGLAQRLQQPALEAVAELLEPCRIARVQLRRARRPPCSGRACTRPWDESPAATS